MTRRILIAVIFSIAAIGFAAVGIVTITSQNEPDSRAVYHQKERDDEATPIVDYDKAHEYDGTVKNRKRKEKNAYYDKQGFVKASFGPEIREVVRHSHWQSDFSAIPVEKSDSIVIGKVLDANAHLSNDKTGIYSEYGIQIMEVLKRQSSSLLEVGKAMLAEREGGRVRYTSGNLVRYLVQGQGSPAKGSTYIFFLSSARNGNFGIITAYELSDGKVIPLDGSSTHPSGGGNWIFDKQLGRSFDDLLQEIKLALKK